MSESESGPIEMNSSMTGDWESLAKGAARNLSGLGDDDTPDLLRELLVFGLDGSSYAVPVERVREIVRLRQITGIPRTPAWMLGVVALRGEVVEVVDLRNRLGLGASTPDRTHRIIVLHGDADRVTGLLVDSVSEVYRVSDREVMPSQGADTKAVSEVCRRGNEFISILDIERAVGVHDV